MPHALDVEVALLYLLAPGRRFAQTRGPRSREMKLGDLARGHVGDWSLQCEIELGGQTESPRLSQSVVARGKLAFVAVLSPIPGRFPRRNSVLQNGIDL
jgi:hypothetical protein